MKEDLTYAESLHLLNDGSWKALDISEKIAVLQAVENEFARRENRQACEVSPKYIPRDKKDGITMGFYSRATQEITINMEQLSSDSKYGNDSIAHLDTVLHEGRHAYQDQAVKGIIRHDNTGELSQWRMNMKPGNYIPYKQNPRAYYKQPIERDAFAYAERMVKQIKQEQTRLREINARHGQDVSAAKTVYLQQMAEGEKSDLAAAKVQYLGQHDHERAQGKDTGEKMRKGISKR